MKTNGDYGELTYFFITFEESQQEHGRRWVMLGARNASFMCELVTIDCKMIGKNRPHT